MSTDLVGVSPSTSVGDAAALMGSRLVGSTVVLLHGKLVGIFTERDIVHALSRPDFSPQDPVDRWMTKALQTIRPEADIEEARRRMHAGKFRHMPVTDESSRLVGMISMRDLNRTSAETT